MKPLQPRRKITLLVWFLVMIGLLAGVVTNGLVGWTLYGLNQERQQLAEQEARLSRGAEKLRRFSRQAQLAMGHLLQLDVGPPVEFFPDRDLKQLRTALKKIPGIPDLERLDNKLGQSSYNLRRIWQRAVAWRDAYRPIYRDDRDKQSLMLVRGQLRKLRADLESTEGRQRLSQALKIRRWRKAGQKKAQTLAAELLSSRNQSWRHNLNNINTELAELSRLVEILAGENRLDQLVDLKDNQLKPSLERLTRELGRLRNDDRLGSDPVPADNIQALYTALFGRGYILYEEYQTIRPGKGGLYLLVQERLNLVQKRERLQAATLHEMQQFEALYPPLAGLTQQRNQELARQAAQSLRKGAFELFMLSLLTLCGFLGLGFLIIRMTRQQLAALGRLQRQNELILASAGEGILGVDNNGETIFINPAAARQLGWGDLKLVGRSYQEILGQRVTPGNQTDPIARVLQQGRPYRSDEELFNHRDGSQLSVACAVNAMRNEQQQIEGAVVTFMDISERKAAEQTLRRYYNRLAEQELALAALNQDLEQKVSDRTLQLEEKNRQLVATQEELAHAEKLAAIGSLAAGVAHEINNPAAIIRGNVEILQTSLAATNEYDEETDEIMRQVERISRITGNLLSFARKQQLNLRDFELNALLEEVLDQVGHQILLSGIEIETELGAGLPLYHGDAERLRQVFTNIIVNGLQALNGNGQLQVRSCCEDGSFSVCIADNGPGISPDVRGQIFHPFFTTKSDGTGLGLSVSYGIVEAHGGSIAVESVPGEGSNFNILLPWLTVPGIPAE